MASCLASSACPWARPTPLDTRSLFAADQPGSCMFASTLCLKKQKTRAPVSPLKLQCWLGTAQPLHLPGCTSSSQPCSGGYQQRGSTPVASFTRCSSQRKKPVPSSSGFHQPLTMQ